MSKPDDFLAKPDSTRCLVRLCGRIFHPGPPDCNSTDNDGIPNCPGRIWKMITGKGNVNDK